MNKYAIVLAAGKGTRMKSARPDVSKVSFPILGRPMVQWVLETIRPLDFEKVVTVVGYGGDSVAPIAEKYGPIARQKVQCGTGNAVAQAAGFLAKEEGVTLVCNGDTPLLTGKTLSALLSSHEAHHNAVTVLTAQVEDPRGQGRIIKTGSDIECIIEEKDVEADFESIHEINARVYVFDNRLLFRSIKELSADVEGEFHLTDIVRHILSSGHRVGAFLVSDSHEIDNVNDRYDLSLVSKALQRRINRGWMKQGVTIEDPDTTYIGPDAVLGKDNVIRPNTYLYGATKLGSGNIIGPSAYLDNVKVGKDNVIEWSKITDCVIGNGASIGPYARLRDGVHVHDGARIGNFNELKACEFGKGSRCAHLSYLGDAKIGEDVNVGCGVITANYDGEDKHVSVIEDHAFIGCNSVLVSPVNVGEGSVIGAGSVIVEDVPSGALGIGRAKQENVADYAAKRKKK